MKKKLLTMSHKAGHKTFIWTCKLHRLSDQYYWPFSWIFKKMAYFMNDINTLQVRLERKLQSD